MTTEYVMVPVPEELVQDVQRLVTWRAALVRPEDLDEQALQAVLDALDAVAQRLLVAVARAVRDGTARSVSALAAQLGRQPLEVLGMVVKLNQGLGRAGGLQATMTLLPNPEDPDDDVVAVHESMADLVLRRLSPP